MRRCSYKMSKKSTFLRNTAVLTAGNFSARLVTVGLMPVITRIYSPEVFGAFVMFMAVTGICVAISCLRYNVAIMITDTRQDSASMTLLCFLMVLATVAVLSIVLSLFRIPLSGLLRIDAYGYLLPLVSLAVLAVGSFQLLHFWFLRNKEFKRLAMSKLADAGMNRSVTIIAGLLGLSSPLGLVIGKLAGQFFSIISLFWGRAREQCSLFKAGSTPEKMKKLAREHAYLPKYSASALFQRANQQLPIILLGAFFSPAIVGVFALAKRTVTEPLQLISESLANSFFQKNAEDLRDGKEIAEFTLLVFKYLLVFTIPALLLFATIAPDLIGFVFGDEWKEAGVYLRYLFPFLVTAFLMRPMSNLFDLYKKQKERMYLAVLNSFVIIFSFSMGKIFDSPIIGIALYSILGTFVLFSRIFWLFSLLDLEKFTILKIVFYSLFIGMIVACPLFAIKFYIDIHILMQIVVSLLCYIIFIFFLYMKDKYIHKQFKNIGVV